MSLLFPIIIQTTHCAIYIYEVKKKGRSSIKGGVTKNGLWIIHWFIKVIKVYINCKEKGLLKYATRIWSYKVYGLDRRKMIG